MFSTKKWKTHNNHVFSSYLPHLDVYLAGMLGVLEEYSFGGAWGHLDTFRKMLKSRVEGKAVRCLYNPPDQKLGLLYVFVGVYKLVVCAQ